DTDCCVLTLDIHRLTGALLYRFEWQHAPGWDSTRTPGRVVTFALLALALLGGLGANDLVRRLRARRRPARIQAAAAALLVGAVLFEGTGSLPHPRVPPVPSALAAATPPLLE